MKSLLASCLEGQARVMHHRDIGPILVELDLVALAGGVLDHEGEEPKVPSVSRATKSYSLEVEGREIAVIILEPLPHQAAHVVRVERERLPAASASLRPGFVIVQQRLESWAAGRRDARDLPSG